MVIMETLFDLISASLGATVGVFVGFFLNRKSRRKMASQVIISKNELNKIKLENQELIQRIQEKENLILQMQMKILGDKNTTSPTKSRRKK